MRIAHVSDIHIRNVKYHDDYRRSFDDLHEKLAKLSVDIVINTGDLAHTKTNLSPEFVEMCSEHVRSICSAGAPYRIILGNHDLNLMNRTRQDAITPIVENLKRECDVELWKYSGLSMSTGSVRFWTFSCVDPENWPAPVAADYSCLNVGLFHGTVRNSVTDQDWTIRDGVPLSTFDAMDFVLMGDIHKRQFFGDGKIGYAGSLIQQNYGEDPEKGFLLWDINTNLDWSVEFVPVVGSRKFYTLKAGPEYLRGEHGELPPVGSRLRVIIPRGLAADHAKIESTVRSLCSPHELTVAYETLREYEQNTSLKDSVDTRDLGVQEALLRRFLEARGTDSRVIEEALDINRRLQASVDKDEDISRGTTFDLNFVAWSGLFGYGDSNVVDMRKLRGIVGLFAPNSSGKSTFIDVLMEALFDKTTMAVRNAHLVNDRKEHADLLASFSVGETEYVIERSIERMTAGVRRTSKEPSRAAVKLKCLDPERKDPTGITKPETERAIRRLVGTYDDFVMSALIAQGRDDDITKCRDTDRKRILFRFMDLDVFEQKLRLAKDESRSISDKLKDAQKHDYDRAIAEYEKQISQMDIDIDIAKHKLIDVEEKLLFVDEQLIAAKSSLVATAIDGDIDQLTAEADSAERAFWDASRRRDEIVSSAATRRYVLDGLREEITKIDKDACESLMDAWDRLTRAIAEFERMRDDEKRRYDEAVKKASIQQRVPCGGKYKDCEFLVDVEASYIIQVSLKANLDDSDRELEELRREVAQIDIESARGNLKKLAQMNADVTSLSVSLKDDEHQSQMLFVKMVDSFRDRLSADKKIELYWLHVDSIKKNEGILTTVREIEQTKKELTEHRKRLEAARDSSVPERWKKQTLLESMVKQRDDIARLYTKNEAYACYMEAMGKDGIAEEVLATRLPELNKLIAEILSPVADFGVIIERDDEQVVNILFVDGTGAERPVQLAGGAQKLIASIAIRVALIKMSSLPKTNMLIIDEGFGSLDAGGVQMMQRLFDSLRTMFDRVIVISHVDVLKDMVDMSIDISKDQEGFAHMEAS